MHARKLVHLSLSRQVNALETDAKNRLKLTLSDGTDSIVARLNSQVDTTDLAKGCLLQIIDYVANRNNDTYVLMISDLKILSQPSAEDEQQENATANKQAKLHPGATPNERVNPQSGKPAPSISPLPVKTPFTPATNLRPSTVTPLTSPANNGGGLSTLPVAPEKKTTHKLEQLHPYDDQVRFERYFLGGLPCPLPLAPCPLPLAPCPPSFDEKSTSSSDHLPTPPPPSLFHSGASRSR